MSYLANIGHYVAIGSRDPDSTPADPSKQLGFIALSSDGRQDWQAVALTFSSGRLNAIAEDDKG